jgi:hypothetical protein
MIVTVMILTMIVTVMIYILVISFGYERYKFLAVPATKDEATSVCEKYHAVLSPMPNLRKWKTVSSELGVYAAGPLVLGNKNFAEVFFPKHLCGKFSSSQLATGIIYFRRIV